MEKSEYYIMPEFNIEYLHQGFLMECECHNTRWKERCHRHKIFGGAYRQKSIDLGLVVFLEPEYHNMTRYGVHDNKDLRRQLHIIGQTVCMRHYGWDKDKFIREFGKNYV